MVTDDRNDSYEVFKCASLEQFELEFKLSHQIVCAFSLRNYRNTHRRSKEHQVDEDNLSQRVIAKDRVWRKQPTINTLE